MKQAEAASPRGSIIGQVLDMLLTICWDLRAKAPDPRRETQLNTFKFLNQLKVKQVKMSCMLKIGSGKYRMDLLINLS